MTDQSILSGFLSMILVVRDIKSVGVYKQMLPTDHRKHGGGARCLDDLTTLGPADVAVWWRWVLAEETDLVASKVHIIPAFYVLVLTPQTGQSWKAGKDGGQTKRNM